MVVCHSVTKRIQWHCEFLGPGFKRLAASSFCIMEQRLLDPSSCALRKRTAPRRGPCGEEWRPSVQPQPGSQQLARTALQPGNELHWQGGGGGVLQPQSICPSWHCVKQADHLPWAQPRLQNKWLSWFSATKFWGVVSTGWISCSGPWATVSNCFTHDTSDLKRKVNSLKTFPHEGEKIALATWRAHYSSWLSSWDFVNQGARGKKSILQIPGH